MSRYLSFILLILILPSVFADGPVWRVTKAGETLYLGGTIHLLGKEDYPLPATLDQGYRAADILVFEIDPDVAASAETQQLFAQYALYQDGRTLQSELKPSTYRELQNFLQVRNLSIERFNTFKPGMLTLVLTVLELQRLGLAGEGVDAFYNRRAKADNKSRLFLESVQQQFDALLAISEGNEDDMLLQTLDKLRNMSDEMRKTKAAWRNGDNAALMAVSLAPWKDAFPELYQSLLVERNHRWLPQIEAMLHTKDVEYVLVGALHLAGPDGLLALLKARGYEVEKVLSR